jgi:hypothetical protein
LLLGPGVFLSTLLLNILSLWPTLILNTKFHTHRNQDAKIWGRGTFHSLSHVAVFMPECNKSYWW